MDEALPVVRGVGVTEWLVGLVPPALVPVLVLLTFLGDPVFLASVAALAYWLGPHAGVLPYRDGARVLAVALAVFTAVLFAKHGLSLQRPPAAWHLADADGFAFPSGHATGSAAVYGAFSWLVRWRDRRTRVALAAGVVGVVGATRLLLGVHFLVDVLAGWAAGAVLAGVLLRVTHREVRREFVAALAFAVAAGALTWPSVDAAAAVGGTSGALLTWTVVRNRLPARAVPVPVAAVGLLGFGGVAYATYRLRLPLGVVAAATTAAGIGFVGLPVVQNFSR